MKTILSTILVFTSAILISSGKNLPEKPLVYVPILPYQFVFEKIAGDLIEVHSITKEGNSCHYYTPTQKQLGEFSKANLLFSGELGFEGNFFVKLGDGISAPKAVSLLDGLTLLKGTCAECAAAAKLNEGKEGFTPKHNHDDLLDAHVWLSPKILKQQSDKIAAELKKFLTPEKGAIIDANVVAFKAELDKVDEEVRTALAPMKGQKFYVYHGAFAYFALDYGIEQVAIEIGNQKPSPRELSKIAQEAKEDGVKVIFVQPQFDQSAAKSLASTIDGEVATLDPLEKDVLANLRRISATLAKACK